MMKLKKIVNLMPDDKFLDYFISMSDLFIPGQSSFVVFSDTPTLKYIKSDHLDLTVLPRSKENYEYLLNSLSHTNVIVFHSFKTSMGSLIDRIPTNIQKVWLFWGFDGYGAIPPAHLVSWGSSRFSFEPNITGYVKFIYNRVRNYLPGRHVYATKNIINKMDYCGTWVDADLQLAKKLNPRIKLLNFNYYTDQLMKMSQIEVKPLNLAKMLLGNSGDATNNHVNALRYLKSINFKGEIVCPLSYGGSKVYVRRICELGKNLFGDQFTPLKTFMPLKEYSEIINSCGFVWMNHRRQQAAGNLLTSFISQKVVITDQLNPLNETFMRWGIKIYDKSILCDFDKIVYQQLIDNRSAALTNISIDYNRPFFELLSSL